MDLIKAIMMGFGILFGCMLIFHLALCFISWVSDVVEHKSWRYWL